MRPLERGYSQRNCKQSGVERAYLICKARNRASTWKEISFQKEILAIGRKKEGNENLKEIGRKFDGEMRNLKKM